VRWNAVTRQCCADPDRFAIRDQSATSAEVSHFLNIASSDGAHLAVALEYSFPWEAPQSAVPQGGCDQSLRR
jgi:hypothetical protein